MAMTAQDEVDVKSDSTMSKQEETVEHRPAQITNIDIQTASNHQPDTVSDNLDMTSCGDNVDDIHRVSKSAIDKLSDVGQDTVVTESAIDTDSDGGSNKMVTVLTIGKDLEDSHNEEVTELSVDKDGKGDANNSDAEADVDRKKEDDEDEVPAKSATEEVVENYHTADQVNATKSGSVGQTLEIVEVETNDSGGDEDQFMSPAASSPDILENSSPAAEPQEAGTKEEGRMPWSAKVPLLDTEPPAIDSDYEEAPLCGSEENLATSTAHPDSRQPQDDSSASDARQDGSSNIPETTSVPATAIKPKPM